MPNRDRSDLPENTPMFQRDESVGQIIDEILVKYPQHKRVLFLKARYENDQIIIPSEIAELNKFKKLLLK
jgi:hypothetical protein